jgi:hypothetical protein
VAEVVFWGDLEIRGRGDVIIRTRCTGARVGKGDVLPTGNIDDGGQLADSRWLLILRR